MPVAITHLLMLLALLAAADAPRAVAERLSADDLGRRIEAAEGQVLMSYPTRDGVRGDDSCMIIQMGGGRTTLRSVRGRWTDDKEYPAGPAQVLIEVRDGKVRRIAAVVGEGGRYRKRADLDLGTVDPTAAATYLLNLVPNLPRSVAEDAITAAMVAADTDCTPTLLAYLRDRRLDDDVRGSVMTWAAELAGAKLAPLIGDLVDEDEESMELREHAVLALSQLQDEESLQKLLAIARHHPEARLQQMAIMCAARHTGDPRVIALLEEILTAP